MGYTEGLKVRVLKNVRGCDFTKPGALTIENGMEVNAVSNPNGAISGICQNGERLGLYPDEFEFITAPEWVLRIWVRHKNRTGDSALALLKAGA